MHLPFLQGSTRLAYIRRLNAFLEKYAADCADPRKAERVRWQMILQILG